MPNTTLKYNKATTQSDLTVSYSFDTLSVSTNTASTGVYLTLTAPTQEIAGCTVTKGATGSGISTITTNVTDGFKYLKVGQVVTLKSGSEGGAVLATNSAITSKTNNNTIIVNTLTGNTNSTTANATTIVVAGVSTNIALAKIQITLNGLGSTALYPVVKTTYFDGSVSYANANDSNTVDTQTSTKSIPVETLMLKAAVPPSNSNTVDLTV